MRVIFAYINLEDPFNISGLIVVAISAAVILVVRYVILKAAPILPKREIVAGGSVLVAYYSSIREVIPMSARGMLAGMPFSTLVVSGLSGEKTDELAFVSTKSANIYNFTLPFVTSSHLVAITKTDNDILLSEFLNRRQLDKIELEGSFPEDFMIYAPPGNQVNVRYLLDPKAMAFVVDFCKYYNFEIQNNSLLIAERFDKKSGDNSINFEDFVERFASEIKPALVIRSDKTLLPSGVSYGTNSRELHCPRCTQKLEYKNSIHVCPEGHGELLFGAQMIDLRSKAEHRKTMGEVTNKQADIKCPNCAHEMKQINYQTSGILIDTCSFCGYRWLDAGEHEVLFGDAHL